MIKKYTLLFLVLPLFFVACNSKTDTTTTVDENLDTPKLDFNQQQLIATAESYLTQTPVPITSASSDRSAGGIHDFYSEGDYWWPDPDNPDGPYIRKDGQTNPENFTAHRIAMRNLNQWVSALVAAAQVSGDKKYADHAIQHLEAFFLNPATLMNPNLLYAQAIKGKVTGRGIGIIDTIHLIEVARAIEQLLVLGYLDKEKETGLKNWFEQYAIWMNTHEYGLAEKDHGNNHSTWWAAQMAGFAHLIGREDLMDVARGQFKKLLSNQMAADGRFPDELSRTKPYIYTLFNLEGYSTLCKIASDADHDLWNYQSKNGSFKKAWDFMVPYMQDKSNWIKPPDVMYYDQIPIQSPGLLFAAHAYNDHPMFDLWSKLTPERKSEEINRNFPIREPVLWIK